MGVRGRVMQVDDWRRIWKKKIDKRVKMVAVKKWREGMEAKVTMRWYTSKLFPMKKTYDGSWGRVLWFRVRTDWLEINGRTHH